MSRKKKKESTFSNSKHSSVFARPIFSFIICCCCCCCIRRRENLNVQTCAKRQKSDLVLNTQAIIWYIFKNRKLYGMSCWINQNKPALDMKIVGNHKIFAPNFFTFKYTWQIFQMHAICLCGNVLKLRIKMHPIH